MPVFRLNKAFRIARDLKAFLNLRAGVTRGAVPDLDRDLDRYEKQTKKLRIARQKDRQVIREQRKQIEEQSKALLNEQEISRLQNELRAAEERVEGATKSGSVPRCCVVSLATDDRDYSAGLDRLERSLERVGFSGGFMCWRPGSFPDDCPTHVDVPFAFKPYCLAEARRRGGELLLWIDANCVAVRPLEPIFDQIERDGYILFRQYERWRVGQWASDEALGVLGLSRDQAMEMPEVNAAVIGLNTSSHVSNSFLEKWLRAAQEGVAFRGVSEQVRTKGDFRDVKWNRGGRVSSDPRVRGHRHDQTVAGVLAAQLGMKLSRSEGLRDSSRDTSAIDPKTRITKVRGPVS